MSSTADPFVRSDPVKDALLAWKAAFKPRRNVEEANAALSAFPVSSWKTWQLLDFAESVWATITEDEEEDEEDDGGESEAESEGSKRGVEDSRAESLHEEDVEREDNLYVGVQFSDLLWRLSAKKEKLLVKLLWGAATAWESAEVSEAEDCDVADFAGAVDRWYSVHSKLDEAKAFAWSLLKVNKWGPAQLQSLWEETGAFKAVWKGLTLPEWGRVIRLAVKNSRARFRSYSSFNQESDSEESDEDSDVDDAEDFDEVYSVASMFRALCKMLELPQDQQRELFKAGMKGLFEPEMLGTLMDEELGLSLTPEEWEAVVKEETPEQQARFFEEMLQEEALWGGARPPRQSVPFTAPTSNGSYCMNNAKRGCLRGQCGACCKKAPGGACAVHLGSIPPAAKAPKLGQCMGGASFAAAAPPSAACPSAPLAHAHAPAPVYREPLYTPQETRLVRSAGDLEELLKASVSGIKKIVFKGFNVNNEQFARLVAIVPKLECLEMSDGEGYMLSGDAIKGLAAACPSLKKISMGSAHHITDKTFAALLEGCPALEHLGISGNDKVSGQLSDKSLKLIEKDAALVPNLRKLYIVDQHVSQKGAEKVVKTRPQLHIQGGTSDGDGYASFMVMQAQMCSYGDGIWRVGAGVVKPRGFGTNYSAYNF